MLVPLASWLRTTFIWALAVIRLLYKLAGIFHLSISSSHPLSLSGLDPTGPPWFLSPMLRLFERVARPETDLGRARCIFKFVYQRDTTYPQRQPILCPAFYKRHIYIYIPMYAASRYRITITWVVTHPTCAKPRICLVTMFSLAFRYYSLRYAFRTWWLLSLGISELAGRPHAALHALFCISFHFSRRHVYYSRRFIAMKLFEFWIHMNPLCLAFRHPNSPITQSQSVSPSVHISSHLSHLTALHLHLYDVSLYLIHWHQCRLLHPPFLFVV